VKFLLQHAKQQFGGGSYVLGQMLVVDGGMTVGGFEYMEKRA